VPARALVLACLLALVLPASALADPADLDGSFASGGVTTVDFSGASYAEDAARQPDGKLLVVGGLRDGSNWDWAVTRVNADGGKDSSYGGGGTQEWPEGGTETGATAVAVESDGEIDVAGDASGKVDLFRFSSTGTVLAH